MRIRDLLVWLVGAVALVIALVAIRGAIVWYHRPFVGVLIDADGLVSSYGLPTWPGVRAGLHYPDRIVAIDGATLPRGAESGGALDAAISDAYEHGRRTAHARVESGSEQRDVELTIEPFGSGGWWWLGGLSIFVGLLYVGAGMIAMFVRAGALAQTFAKTALLGGLFMLTLFDVHTTRTLVPVWNTAFAMLPASCVAFALRLPDDVAILARHRWILPALDLSALALATVTVSRGMLGLSTVPLHAIASGAEGFALVFLATILLVRFLRSTGQRRATLSSLISSMVPVYALMGACMLITLLAPGGIVLVFAGLPLLAIIPLVTGYAYLRHDLWRSNAVVSRVVTLASVGTLACLVALGLGAGIAAALGVPLAHALLAATCGGTIAAVLVSSALRATDNAFFPTIAGYKPSIDQLSEDLLIVARPSEVTTAVERLVSRWVPCDRVNLELGEQLAQTAGATLQGREISMPVTFRGETLATLRVEREMGALFTSEDVDLLRTITNLAALALAHARAYAELEQRRQQQVAASRGERMALLETIAAEIAHEVRYSINFFRAVFAKKEGSLDREELDIGREEVERLERLVASFRPLATQRVDRGLITVRELANRTEVLVRDALGERTLEIDAPSEVALRCDADKITQVLVNMVSNAIEATKDDQRVGIRWTKTATGATLTVWDSGPGFEGDGAQLFAPWYTTKASGTGLGLAISHRLARSHGWSLQLSRIEGLTCFDVVIRAEDIVTASAHEDELA